MHMSAISTHVPGRRTRQTGQMSFYPCSTVTFTVTDPARQHHVPVLPSPFAYPTHQGS